MSADELGYKQNTVIFFKWIFYCKNLSVKFPLKHILNSTGQDVVRTVLQDILDQDVGVCNDKITAQFLFKQKELKLALKALIAAWNPLVVKELYSMSCTKPYESVDTNLQAVHCSVDKCMFKADEISESMAAATVAHQCLSSEATGVSNANINYRKMDDQENVASKLAVDNTSSSTPNEAGDSSCNCGLDECYSSKYEKKLVINELSFWNQTSAQQIGEPKSLCSNMSTSLPTIPCTSTAELHLKNPTLIPMKPPMNFRCILEFMRIFIHNFVPLPVLGSKYNQKCLHKAVKNLLSCGYRDEFHLGTLMVKMKINDFKWTNSMRTMQDKQYVVAKLLVWIVQRMILVVIRTFFYVTECAAFGHMILYYPKDVWCHMVDLTMNQLQKHRTLELVPTSEESRNLETKQEPEVTPRMRFIPKKSGMRPIYPLKKDVYDKLKILKMKLLTSSVTKSFHKSCIIVNNKGSTADVWSSYVERLQKLAVPPAPFYVVKVDISDAYGSVLHSVLIRLLENFVSRLPTIVRYKMYSATEDQGSSTEARHYVMEDTKGNVLENPGLKQRCHSSKSITFNVRRTAAAIKHYIEHQYVSAGRNRKFLVKKGIAQGGSLSSALCEMYYVSMYYTYWQNLIGPKDVCMHSVDDFLFVSTEKTNAEKFLAVSSEDVLEYNCRINPRKTLQNVSTNASPIRVPFCGVTFCSHSGQFLVSAGSITSVPPRYTLKIAYEDKPLEFVTKRLLQITEARLPAAVLHPTYTTTKGLMANVHRVGMSVGARLEALCGAVLLVNDHRIDAKFIAFSLVSLGARVWRKIKLLWEKKKGCTFTVPYSLVVATYLGGVGAVLCLPGHIPVPEVLLSITSLRDHFASQVSSSDRHLLPSVRPKKKRRPPRHQATASIPEKECLHIQPSLS
ncbi:Telomerase ribonucleoprotein complex - RNA-binding domain [Trinorchestia longiramus]|nr:Telomerase ribonucleoprotein complex - RNA-binding domain [Trinorchestia longiramus]